MKTKFYGYPNCPKRIKQLLNKLVENFKQILQNNLEGIYLHGSLAMESFNAEKSDMDIMIVVKNPLSKDEKERLSTFCLDVSNEIGGKGLEMSIILESEAKNPVYPMPFEFHYSESWRSKFERGSIGPFPKGDPDLSAHLRIINDRGIALHGKPIHETFGKISDKDYIRALLYDLEDIPQLLTKQPDYYVLNTCRVLGFLKTGKVMSKIEGGKWYVKSDFGFKDVVGKALESYTSSLQLNFDSDRLNEFVKDMLDKIAVSQKLKNP